ncbi:Transcriptional regulatory protein [Wickerhamomyces ciferrii]|uniref:Transcriptional regulatory protein n=1 Tax=Wickerhamomyces ciferrii (strain ATCC 14091 / BCRC 22168 / CBS 111 / JCM 3599 / NBRC 0793 / NRRL Y-1031 F-60-10) TaxID=1206466 RepID=K0KG60_WICCF|nr:Transcriptional regulatory protein [Wickerhamomyces ciferrii]CCH41936.1 Transcriptional regulatory protein [Wickerhamomyces ciferrii]
MPPRGSSKEAPSASESEAKNSSSHNNNNNPNSRASTKARNAAAQAAQAELLARHIHSNGPKEKTIADPLDFDSFPDEALRKYRDHYGLPVKSSLTTNGYLLASEIGKKTYSFKSRDRVTKPDLANAVKKHFSTQTVKESEIITNFIYKANNQDKAFKLNFKN